MELLHPLLLVLCGLLCLGRISAPSDIPAGESRLETAQMPGLTEDGKESAGNADQTGSEERTAGNASDAIEISGGLELPEITIFRADDEAAEGDAAEGTARVPSAEQTQNEGAGPSMPQPEEDMISPSGADALPGTPDGNTAESFDPARDVLITQDGYQFPEIFD